MEQKNARGYIRVSTIGQREDGVSLQTQQQRIIDFCQYEELNLVEIYVDAGVSAGDRNRPGLQRILNDIRKGERFIVTSLSRLSRKVRDSINMLEDFKEGGIKFMCLDNRDLDLSTTIGQMVVTILGYIAQIERENVAIHTSENLRRLSREGKLRSRSPFGFKFKSKDKNLIPDEQQQEVLKKIKRMHAAGTTLSQIARTLNENGDNECLNNNKPNPLVNPIFFPQTIKTILTTQTKINQRIMTHHPEET